jgi:putative membrane protein
MAHRPLLLSETDHDRVSAAVAAAEAHTAGEIVTVVAQRSDGYADIALAWAALVAFTALTALSLFPDFYLGLLDRVLGHWAHEWTARQVFTVALGVATLKFIGMLLLQLWQPLKLWLVPSHIKALRVRDRATAFFKTGAERRTHGRTGILIYLSLAEHRAEIVADLAIAEKVRAEVWGEAMAAMLVELKARRLADGMIAAVERVGRVLAEHFPRAEDDTNELPDRLIEV